MGNVTSTLRGGVVAGIVGGIAVSVWLVALNVAQGGDVWPVLKGAGLPFLGERAASPGYDAVAVAVGLACHFAVSIGWGLSFAAFFRGLSREVTMVAGAFWGLVVWVAMYYVVLPLVGGAAVVENTPVWAAIVSHLIFGIGLAFGYLPFQRPARAEIGGDVGAMR